MRSSSQPTSPRLMSRDADEERGRGQRQVCRAPAERGNKVLRERRQDCCAEPDAHKGKTKGKPQPALETPHQHTGVSQRIGRGAKRWHQGKQRVQVPQRCSHAR